VRKRIVFYTKVKKMTQLKLKRIEQAKKLFKKRPNLTSKQIAKILKVSLPTVMNYKRELKLTNSITDNGKKLGRPKTNAIIKIAKNIKRIIIELR
jgi:Fic family protein